MIYKNDQKKTIIKIFKIETLKLIQWAFSEGIYNYGLKNTGWIKVIFL